MYGYMPYIFPNQIMQATPLNTGLTNAANLGNSIGAAKTGLAGFLSKINLSSILTNAQKTLNVVNQAVPLYYQVKPVFKNIKTLGKIGREFKNMGSSSNISTLVNTNSNENNTSTVSDTLNKIDNNTSNGIPNPTFFL